MARACRRLAMYIQVKTGPGGGAGGGKRRWHKCISICRGNIAQNAGGKSIRKGSCGGAL